MFFVHINVHTHQEGDALSVKTLISLGADVNIQDEFGSTPLDYAIRALTHPKSETNVAMVNLDRTDFLEAVQLRKSAVHKLSSTPIEYPLKDSKVIMYLKSVGGTHGKSISSLSNRPKNYGTHVSSTTSSGSDSELQSTEDGRQDKNHVSIARINCEFYHEIEHRANQLLEDSDAVQKPEEAIEIVKLLKLQEEYRRKCGSRILCLDGGGIRGLVQLTILEEIERRTDKRITELFDWIIGTSTGGIIVLALVYGKTGMSTIIITFLADYYLA